MIANKPMSAKILVGSEGLGLPDAELVAKRAWEVAEIESREIPNASDWAEARRELHGRSAVSDISSIQGEGEIAAQMSGAMRSASEEPNVGEELFREGMEEAEHERMLLSRHSDAEPLE